MKTRLIVNPVSGTDTAPDYLPVMNELLRGAFGDVDISMTTAAGDALHLAQRAAREGCARILVAGGDGTLNEALNGVASVEGALARTTFGIIPLGTGNDFAAALGLPEDVEGAVEVLLGGRELAVDVGVLNERYFVNVSAGGFIAEVSGAVDPQLKSWAGKFAYIIGGAQVLLNYEPVRARVRAEDGQGRPFERDTAIEMFAVCNSRLVGGGQPIAPHAVIDDGLLDVCLVEDMTTLDFIGLLSSVPGGSHIEDERVEYLRARALDIEFDREIKVNTDGEVMETRRCRYSVLPRAARFLAGDAPFAAEQGGGPRD
ncbi:MAG TPA: diacylglycerol kinase family protein [Pyrinomonadaceae bacterium]|nr:diacylglycerol kinase family protein [Pyrinomonadaceae bacterium]